MKYNNYQDNLLKEISKVMAIISPPLLVLSLSRIPTMGFIFVMKLQVVCVLATILNFFLLGKINRKFNISSLIIIFFIIGIGAIYQNKSVVFGHIFFLCSILISSVFFNFTQTIFIFIISLLLQYIQSYFLNIPISNINILAGMILSFGIIRTIYQMRSALESINHELKLNLEQKKIFFSSLTHELRTPLVGVKNGIDLLKSTNLNDAQKDLINIIDFSNRSLIDLVNEILDFSKLEQKKVILIKEYCNLSNIFQISINLHQLAAKKKDLQLVTHIDIPSDTLAYIDEIRFIQIINNLLSNSIKYTYKGSVTLFASIIQSAPESPSQLVLKIKDTGIGISKEQIDHVFEPFNQSIANQKARIEGTGLGLSITKELIYLFDGTIQINSIIGCGTEVILHFPINVIKELKASLPNTTNVTFESLEEKLKKHKTKILIVDDNDINRKILEMTVSKLNIEVETASSGDEVLKILDKNNFDIIFLDLLMPGLSGEETAAKIRESQNQNFQNTYIVACSANINEQHEYDFKSKLMNDCLGKPINKKSLTRVLNTYLESTKTSV